MAILPNWEHKKTLEKNATFAIPLRCGSREQCAVTKMIRVEVKSKLLKWACDRAGFDHQELAERIPQFPAWERGDLKPTLKQLERFAKTVHAPVGYMFLSEPPVERVPIPDFRTIGNEYIGHPTPDLLETIYLCQQRQEWYRDYVRSMGEAVCPFVGTATLAEDAVTAAARIRHALRFDLDARRRTPLRSGATAWLPRSSSPWRHCRRSGGRPMIGPAKPSGWLDASR
jgi:hypothetical protein